MFIAHYEKTMRGVKGRLELDLRRERRLRIEAQRAFYEAKAALERRDTERRQAQLDRAAEMARILRSQGIRFKRSYVSIEKAACRVFGLNRTEIQSNRRTKEVVFARQFIMYWASRLTILSLPQIGRLMGGRDHTTILHGRRIYPSKRAAMSRKLRSLDRSPQPGDGTNS